MFFGVTRTSRSERGQNGSVPRVGGVGGIHQRCVLVLMCVRQLVAVDNLGVVRFSC